MYRTTKQFLRAFHLSSLDDLPEMPDLGGEGQMRLNENGEIVDPAEEAEITGADTPETAAFQEPEETETAAKSADNGTFWSRVAQMFKDFWAAITGIFR